MGPSPAGILSVRGGGENWGGACKGLAARVGAAGYRVEVLYLYQEVTGINWIHSIPIPRFNKHCITCMCLSTENV